MKKYTFLLLILVLFKLAGGAQPLRDINVSLSDDNNNIRHIELLAGDLVFSINQKGNVRLKALRPAPYTTQNAFTRNGKLTSLNNIRIDYYDNFNANSAGKLKSAGNIEITYRDQFDGLDNRGRVKTIGDVIFAYYDRFDGIDNRGKIKSIGDLPVTYYDRFDGSDLNGRLKSVGNTVIKYYDRFDGADRFGKIKSITGDTPHISISGIAVDDE